MQSLRVVYSPFKTKPYRHLSAFTLVEVLVALAIAGIALVPLLELQVGNILLSDKAVRMSQAILLADLKMAEVRTVPFPDTGTDSGSERSAGDSLSFEWRAEVEDFKDGMLEHLGVTEIRRIRVVVSWGEGRHRQQVSLSSLVANNQ